MNQISNARNIGQGLGSQTSQYQGNDVCVPTPLKQSQLSQMSDSLAQEVSRLEEVVKGLYSKLQSVMRQEPEGCGSDNKVDKIIYVDAVARLNDVRSRLNSQVEGIITILNKLEV